MRAKDKIASIITTLFIWGLAGALFGALFGGLQAVLAALGLTGWQPVVFAAAVAAMTTSAFYSAMPVALVGAMAGILASIGYLMVSGQNLELLMIAATAGAGGVLAGIFYAWMETGGGRPLAETLTGLISGLMAGAILTVVFTALGTQIGLFALSAGVVALVGTFFQVSQRWLVAHTSRWFPAALSAPIVAGLIAAVVGSSVWIIGGTTSGILAINAQDSANQILNAVPPGFLGGMLGGAVTGVLLQTLGFRLEQPH